MRLFQGRGWRGGAFDKLASKEDCNIILIEDLELTRYPPKW